METYKFLQRASDMTTKELTGKVASCLISSNISFPLNLNFNKAINYAEKLTILMEEGDEESYQHALTVLLNYSQIIVEKKLKE